MAVQQFVQYAFNVVGDGSTTSYTLPMAYIPLPLTSGQSPTGVFCADCEYEDNTQEPSEIRVGTTAEIDGANIVFTFENAIPSRREISADTGPIEATVTVYLLF